MESTFVLLLLLVSAAAFDIQSWPNAKLDTPHAKHIATWMKENKIEADIKLTKVMEGLALWDFCDMTDPAKTAIVLNAKLTGARHIVLFVIFWLFCSFEWLF